MIGRAMRSISKQMPFRRIMLEWYGKDTANNGIGKPYWKWRGQECIVPRKNGRVGLQAAMGKAFPCGEGSCVYLKNSGTGGSVSDKLFDGN